MVILFKTILKEEAFSSPHQLSFSNLEEMNQLEPVKDFLGRYNNVLSYGNYVPEYQAMAKMASQVPNFLDRMRQTINKISGGNTTKCWRGLALYKKQEAYDNFINLKLGDKVNMTSWNARTVFSWAAYINRAVRFAVKSMSQNKADLGVIVEALIPHEQMLYFDNAFSAECFDSLASEWGYHSIKHYSFENEAIVIHSRPLVGKLVYHSSDPKGTKKFLDTLSKTKWDEW